MTALPAAFSTAVEARLAAYDAERIGLRIWEKDHTVWKPDPTEITDRLGWLGAPGSMLDDVDQLIRVASDADSAGYKNVMLLGMGGSSLAPEVFASCFGPRGGMARLHVLDTTDPAQILATHEAAPPDQALYLVASKSGGTIETLSQYHFFRAQFSDARRFMAITDPGSKLEALARDDRFFRTFHNDPDIGGRYSALSLFGIVPAVLMGIDIEGTLARGTSMARDCGPAVSAADNPGAWLGVVLGEAALAGRDKLTIVLPERLRSFGWWIEQLIAESTGKEGTGILPVEGEAPGAPELYGDDRVFVVYGEHSWVDALADAGHPVVRYPEFDEPGLGAEFYRWEYATAVACWILGVNPFDQPNVQEAKDATARMLEGGNPVDDAGASAADVLGTVSRGDYIALCAFAPRDDAHGRLLEDARERLRRRYGVPVTVGYGPRYLHSTGQLHKGGPNTGVFLQIVTPDEVDIEIPGRDYTFAGLKRAQADGELASLLARGRRVARLTAEELAELAAQA